MPANDGDIHILQVNSSLFRVECVVSAAALQRGLSGRKSLPSGTGMLFIFPSLSKQSMWMPDMHFPLDVVWLDENLSVVNISHGLQPCATKESCPSSHSVYDAKYAIEMVQGDANKYGFREGMNLSVA